MATITALDDLYHNPTPRVPVALCLDSSGSMRRDGKIKELVEGVNFFYDAVDEDDEAHDAVEISIVTFNDQATLVQDFADIEHVAELESIAAQGRTEIGSGVNLSLDILEKRKKDYFAAGVQYHQPWLVLMTDGKNEGSGSELERAIKRVNDLVTQGKLTVMAFGIGDEADMNLLQRFTPGDKPWRLRGVEFVELFKWLSQSVATVSGSMVDEPPRKNVKALKGFTDF